MQKRCYQSTAFLLMLLQVSSVPAPYHSHIGYLSLLALTLGLASGCFLAEYHQSIASFGGIYATYGFWAMALECYVPAIVAIEKRQSGDVRGHKQWIMRYVGAMFGAFGIFRLLLVAMASLMPQFNATSYVVALYVSSPIGFVLGDLVFKNVIDVKHINKG